MSRVTAEQLKEATMKFAENFDMIDWAYSYTMNPKYIRGNLVLISEIGTCGTAACLAGNTCLIAGDKLVREAESGDVCALTEDGEIINVEDRATELLGNPEDSWSMFRTSWWPDEYKDAYINSESSVERAEIACKVVDHFMGGQHD